MDSAQAWSNCFAMNGSIIHLNLAQNDFTCDELKIMAEGMRQNHSIIGLHMEGNECYVDAFGQIRPFEVTDLAAHRAADHYQQEKQINYNFGFVRISDQLCLGSAGRGGQVTARNQRSNCWICEGWTPHEFRYRPKEEVDIATVPVRLHIDCDEYEGELLEVDPDAGLPNLSAVDMDQAAAAAPGLAKQATSLFSPLK